MTTETVNKTVRCKLRGPSEWKREKLDRVIEQQRQAAQLFAMRMPSVQKEKWGNIRNTCILKGWVDQEYSDTDLYKHDLYHGVGCDVAANFLTAREKNKPLPSPDSFSDWSHFVICPCGACKEHAVYERNDCNWGVRVSLHKPWQEGRVWFRILAGDYQRDVLTALQDGNVKQGKAEIHRKNGAYYLHQSYSTEVEVYEEGAAEYVAGIDLGLKNIATIVVDGPDGVETVKFFDGGEVRHYRERMYEKRREFQEAGRDDKVKELRDREHLFVENRNHTISRRIVERVADLDSPVKIVLEDLTGYRQTLVRNEKEYSEDDRRILHSWPFRKLQSMIEYKAREEGIPVVYVNPHNTSQRCNKCGEKGDSDRDRFYCEECEYEVNADFNGAANIASRASVTA